MPMPCSDGKHEVFWYPEPNEEGWRCCACDFRPGEPPGFDPQRDRDEIGRKVGCILRDMHEAHVVYISNGSMGDGIERSVAARCEAAGVFDSYSIALYILEALTPGHAKYWREVSEGVIDGHDIRKRCWCGELSTCSSLGPGDRGWQYRCSKHIGVENPQRSLALEVP